MPVPDAPITPCLLVGDGAARRDLADSLLELEVEEHHELANVFRSKLAIVRGEDGLWSSLDQGAVVPWARVEIKFRVGDREEPVIVGYVTQVRVHVDAAEGNSYLELVGMDTTSLMSAEEVIKDWPGKSDADIASEIFAKYGLSADVEATEAVHAEAVSTIVQRESDIQFLKRLARRNGFECVVDGTRAFFGPPALGGDPLPALAAHFGDETNLTSFDASWNALRPTTAAFHQIDTITKEVLSSAAGTPDQVRLGRDGPVAPSLPAGGAPRAFVRHAVATGLPEMAALTTAIANEAEWFIEARGEVDAVQYGDLLRARRLVPVKGVGELLSGLYYLTSVKHLYTSERYVQQFTARRNATVALPGDLGGGLPS